MPGFLHHGAVLGGGLSFFDAFKSGTDYLPGVDQLDASLTINSTTVTPTVRYKGGDADKTNWDHWGYGGVLGYNANGGTVSVNQGSPLFGSSNDDSVLFDGNAYYAASLSSLGSITTEDFVIEIVYKIGATNNDYIFSKWNSVDGILFYIDGSGRNQLLVEENNNIISMPLDLPTANSWYHLICFVNRDENSTNGGKGYINGVLAGSTNFYANAGSLSNNGVLQIGAGNGANNPFGGNVAYVSMWKQANWHKAGAAGPVEWVSIARERFSKLNGTYAVRTDGGDCIPTFTRAGVADLTNASGTYSVGVNWPRVEPDGFLCAAGDGDSDLEYDLTGPTTGSLVATVLLVDEDTAADGILAELHNATANEMINLRVDAGSDSAEIQVTDGGVAQATVTGSTDISDNTEHTIAGSWTTNNVKVFVGGASEGTPDTTATMPTTTKLSVGADQSGANNFEGHISDLKIYTKFGKSS